MSEEFLEITNEEIDLLVGERSDSESEQGQTEVAVARRPHQLPLLFKSEWKLRSDHDNDVVGILWENVRRILLNSDLGKLSNDTLVGNHNDGKILFKVQNTIRGNQSMMFSEPLISIVREEELEEPRSKLGILKYRYLVYGSSDDFVMLCLTFG